MPSMGCGHCDVAMPTTVDGTKHGALEKTLRKANSDCFIFIVDYNFKDDRCDDNMTTLRAKQKAQRRAQIEQATRELVAEKGFNLTTIEEIADRALVSPATVYNYYGNKGELLLALIAHGEEGTKARLADVEERALHEPPAELLADIICQNMRDTLAYMSREVWGHVVAYVATTPDPEVGARYLGTVADALADVLAKAIRVYIRTGRLRELDADAFAYLLTRLERNHFLSYVYLKSMTFEDLSTGLRQEIRILIEPLSL